MAEMGMCRRCCRARREAAVGLVRRPSPGCTATGETRRFQTFPPSSRNEENPTLSGHSAQRRDSCKVVTFQMEVMRLHPAVISNRAFAPLQPSLWSRSEVPRHRRSPLLPSTARHRQILALSHFRASTQKRQTASPRRLVVRQTRFAGFSGQEKRIVCTCLAIIGGRARKQGPGSAHNKCDWRSRNAHIL
jgi:hypothetical protein